MSSELHSIRPLTSRVVFVVAGLLLGAGAAIGGESGTSPGQTLTGSGGNPMPVFHENDVERTVTDLATRVDTAQVGRLREGVQRALHFWRAEDGGLEDFAAFCESHFIADPSRLEAARDRFERQFEYLSGHAVALTRALRDPLDLDAGEPLPVDSLFASLNPFDHLSDDLFASRIAFVGLLNWRARPLDELIRDGATYDRATWVDVRLGQTFTQRVPGEARQAETRAFAAADEYVSAYNIRLDHVLTPDGRRPFPEGLRLISHWGLRDEIKSEYSDPKANLEKQRLIYTVMERIVRQEIPRLAIDGARHDWDPATNRLFEGGRPLDAFEREPDERYERILEVFRAERGVDPWSPLHPTYLDRKFGIEREIPEEAVRGHLVDVLEAPVARKVARLIEKRLGRKLEPFDIWYDGFKARGSFAPEELDRVVREKYPTAAAFQADLPNILERLGFTPETSRFLSERIVVDASRGAGHALGAGMRTDAAHLRTRIGPRGMDYKGYNIALHELGHCVEQTFSLYRVDHTLLAGVPNNAFTEAFAFMFQARDLEVLGLVRPDPARDREIEALRALDEYWAVYEIAGVSILDIDVWKWLYAHPEATAVELRAFTVARAIELWNRYYAPVLGVRDSPVLAIYSHMVSYALYLADYPMGHLIDFQLERYMKGRNMAVEMERMCVQGRITPDAWMRGAVGAPISARPLVDAAGEATRLIKK
jgi:hypothetical protein